MNEQMEQIETLTSDAIREVFQGMLSIEVTGAAPKLPDPNIGQIAGSVGFVGKATGVIYMYAGVDFASIMTQKMLGLAESEVEDEMINDAVGELSNMVVGYVKSRLCDRGWPCTLTIPSIVRGRQLAVESPANVARKVIGFRSDDRHLVVELLLKENAS
jgi:chemotaxis protein CheX